MEEIYRAIQENYSMRFYSKQKLKFRNYMIAKFQELGYFDYKIDKAKNIIIGDCDTAKVVYSAHYDTPMLSFFITPFTRIFGHLLGSLVSALVLATLLTLPQWLAVFHIIKNSIWTIAPIIIFPLFFFFPNPRNANDNTSGVLAVYNIAKKLKEENKTDGVAFILFNCEELGLIGSSKFVKEYKIRNNRLPNFFLCNLDCVGVGSHILLAYNRISKDVVTRKLVGKTEDKLILKKANIIYASDNLRFYNSIMLSCMSRSLINSFYIPRIHMPYDNAIDFRTIENICNIATLFLPEEKSTKEVELSERI